MFRTDRFPRRAKRPVSIQGPLCFNRAGRERVYPDILGRMINRHRLRELDQRTLRRAIGRAPGAPDPPELANCIG